MQTNVPLQMFNTKETELFWKKTRDVSYNDKRNKIWPVLRLQNTCLQSYLLQKLLGAARNPRDLKNIAKPSLFVVHESGWIRPFSKIGFQSLFNQTIKWCNKNTCPLFMLLLVIDNAPAHSLLDDYLLCQHPGGVLAPEYHSCPETYG
jgi:hypothetical protein